MSISDTYSIPGFGTVFLAPPNTPLPAAGITAFTRELESLEGWENFGHTSRDNPIALAVDGGDATTKGSWLRSALVTQYAETTWTATGASIQTDRKTVRRIFNGWATADGKGTVVGQGKKATDLAMIILADDDTGKLAFYEPKVAFTYGDAPSFDVENFMELSFAATFLAPAPGVLPVGPDGRAGLFEFYGPDAWHSDNPTGVTPGTPGVFTPAGSAIPASITDLRGLGAIGQTTAWTTGQYVEYGSAQKAHWTGSDWATGVAA